LPVVVHNREAREATRRALTEWAAAGPLPANGLRGMLHCFSEDLAFAQELRALGMLISLAGPVTFPKSTALVEVARGMGSGDLLVETDAPYLAPQPFRGKRNEPAHVLTTAAFVAAQRGETPSELIAATTANARRLFGLP
ncbi:MAG: TatD family hydrolase, partial [Chloroflexi bacterium]|nr:TatD family hydrolase [Chloroflexota bacterium]